MDYSSYRDRLLNVLSALTPPEQYFFGAWCVEYLAVAFANEKVEIISVEERASIVRAIEYMWSLTTDFPAFDEEELYKTAELIAGLDEKNFNQEKFPDYTAKCVLVALLLVLAYLEENSIDLIVDAAIVLVQEKEFGIIHYLKHDTSKLFQHPLIQHELSQQEKLIQRLLDGPKLTALDRNIFRP